MARQTSLWMAPLIGIVGACAATATAQNLLTDPSFENACVFDPFEGWDKVALNVALVEDGNQRTGARGATSWPSYFSCDTNDPTGANQTGFEQRIPAPAAGTVLNGSVWVKANGQFGAGVTQFVELRFVNAGGCDLACPAERDGEPGVDVFDLLTYLAQWFASSYQAELTDCTDAPGCPLDVSATVDVFDLLTYLSAWFPASAGSPCSDPSSQSTLLDESNTPTAGYVERTVSATVPAGAAEVIFRVIINQVRDSLGEYRDGQQYMDDAFLATAADPGTNLLINPGFETICTTPFFDWTQFGINTVETDFVRTGTYSARVIGPFWFPNNDGGFFQELPATPGNEYQGRIYYMTPSNAVVDPAIDARLRLEFFDQFLSPLGTATTDDLATETTPTTWTLAETPLAVAPPDTAFVRFVYAHLLPFYQGGEMRIDDAELIELEN